MEMKVAAIQVTLQIPHRDSCVPSRCCCFLNYKVVYCLQFTCIAQLWLKSIAGMIKVEMSSVLQVDFGIQWRTS